MLIIILNTMGLQSYTQAHPSTWFTWLEALQYIKSNYISVMFGMVGHLVNPQLKE